MGIECRRGLRLPVLEPPAGIGLGRFVGGTTPAAGRDGPSSACKPGLRLVASSRGDSAPMLIWQVVWLGPVWEPMAGDHDVFGAGKPRDGLAITSTTSMLPRWQCGQIRKDTPVSASCWSR